MLLPWYFSHQNCESLAEISYNYFAYLHSISRICRPWLYVYAQGVLGTVWRIFNKRQGFHHSLPLASYPVLPSAITRKLAIATLAVLENLSGMTLSEGSVVTPVSFLIHNIIWLSEYWMLSIYSTHPSYVGHSAHLPEMILTWILTLDN